MHVHFPCCKWGIKMLWSVKCASLFSLSHHSSPVHLPIHLCSLHGELWMDVPWKSKHPEAGCWLDRLKYKPCSGHRGSLVVPFSYPPCFSPVHKNSLQYIKCHGILHIIKKQNSRAGLILQHVSMFHCFIPIRPPPIFLIGEVGGWGGVWGIVGMFYSTYE